MGTEVALSKSARISSLAANDVQTPLPDVEQIMT